jgi:peptidoglycan/LPS O-acetylase OafA/YrhL
VADRLLGARGHRAARTVKGRRADCAVGISPVDHDPGGSSAGIALASGLDHQLSRLGYVPALAGVRGIAIAAVVGLHFFGLSGGFYGVDLFFVLSGFLITTLLLEERDRHGSVSLRRFYNRRANRLLPALLTVLVVIGVLGSARYTHIKLAEIIGGSVYLANLLPRGILAKTPADHLWTLAQEEQFYLVWPLMLIALLRKRSEKHLLAVLGAVIAVLILYRLAFVVAGASYDRLHYFPDMHADGLLIGCAGAVLWRRGVRVPPLMGAAGLGVVLAAFVFGAQSVTLGVYPLPLVEVACLLVILGAVETGALQRFLSLRPLVWLGLVSYSLYLWQQPARWLVGWHHPLPGLALTALLTLLSYYGVEARFRSDRVRVAAQMGVDRGAVRADTAVHPDGV